MLKNSNNNGTEEIGLVSPTTEGLIMECTTNKRLAHEPDIYRGPCKIDLMWMSHSKNKR